MFPDIVEDLEAVRAFERKLASGEEELIPAEFVDRILDESGKKDGSVAAMKKIAEALRVYLDDIV